MNINLTQKTELENFHYEDIGRNYKNRIVLGNSLLNDIGQLIAYEQGARFIQSLDIPKKDREITLVANIPESYHTYKLTQREISPHIIRFESQGYQNIKKLSPFSFDIEPKEHKWALEDYSYFRFNILTENLGRAYFVYQKPIFKFGRGSVLNAGKLDLLNQISYDIKRSGAKAEFRQEIFHKYGGVMQLVLEGEFNTLKKNTQKNKSIKIVEALENRICELIED